MRPLAFLVLFPCVAVAAAGAELELSPYEIPVVTARLDNGLMVLVSPDDSVSDVAVELWFRVGSASEPAGQHGLAHLFEHMLPSAREVLSNDPNRTVFDRDRLDSNGTSATEYTRMVTRYPSTSVELPIAMLAERMASDPQSITEADLSRHQQTVLAEFRNGSGRTWDAAVIEPVRRALFGADHPYGHGTMGSVIDVEAASLDTMHRWFQRYYGAANSMLVVVGNVDPVQVVALARKHFGSIRAGSPLPAAVRPVTPPEHRRSLDINAPDAVPALDLYWRVPGWQNPKAQDLETARELLSVRLETELGCDVTQSDSFQAAAGGAMSLRIRCNPDQNLETRTLAVLDSFLRSPASSIDVARAKRLAHFGDVLGRLGWRPSRAQLLGEGYWLADDPLAYMKHVERAATATPEQVFTSAREWMRNPLIVRVRAATAGPAPDRSAALPIDEPAINLPADVDDRVVHGVRVLSARRTTPGVHVRLLNHEGPAYARATTRSMLKDDLRELADESGSHGYDLVLVGDIGDLEIETMLQPRKDSPTSSSASSSSLPAFTARPGAAQTTVTAIVSFPNGTEAARVALAADLLRGRLNERLREKERWVYSVDARFARGDGGPVIMIEVPIRDDLAAGAVPVIRSYIEALVTEPFSAGEAARARGAELRRIASLASAPHDLANGLLDVLRSGDSYESYTRTHAALFRRIREGVSLDLPRPVETIWSFAGDPDRVDPSLRDAKRHDG